MINSPIDAYKATRNPQTGSVQVIYDDKNIKDEEMQYDFNKDGSATSTSLAWGVKTQCPQGTFSDLMLNLPNTTELNSELAKSMADTYKETQKKLNDEKINSNAKQIKENAAAQPKENDIKDVAVDKKPETPPEVKTDDKATADIKTDTKPEETKTSDADGKKEVNFKGNDETSTPAPTTADNKKEQATDVKVDNKPATDVKPEDNTKTDGKAPTQDAQAPKEEEKKEPEAKK